MKRYISFAITFILFANSIQISNADYFARDISSPTEIKKLTDKTAGDPDLGGAYTFKIPERFSDVQKALLYGSGIGGIVITLMYKKCEDNAGKFSHLKDLPEEKIVWMDGVRYNIYTGKYEARVCAARCKPFYGIKENCFFMETDRTETKDFPDSSSTITTKTKFFMDNMTGKESGENGVADSTAHNSKGYLYNLHNGECPYTSISSENECINKMLEPGSVPDKFYRYGTPYNHTNNCYLAAKNAFSRCKSFNMNNCVCVARNADKDVGKQNCDSSTNFIPDINGSYWASIDGNKKKCFQCYQVARQILYECRSTSFDNKNICFGMDCDYSNKFKSLMNNLKNRNPTNDEQRQLSSFSRTYGPGDYICAYEKDTKGENKRIGCAKSKGRFAGIRPMPRIAFPTPTKPSSQTQKYIDDYGEFFVFSGSHLFQNSIFVADFRSTADDKCSKPAELGARFRGDFYNPAIKLQYGMNQVTLWFIPADDNRNIAFYDRYISRLSYNSSNPLDASILGSENSSEYSSRISEWSSEYPVQIYHGKNSVDKECVVNIDKEVYEKVCARIEYNEFNDREYFVAYRMKNAYLASQPCNTLYNSNLLIRIGGVERPPLKYRFNSQSGRIETPLSIESLTASPTFTLASVLFDPNINECYAKEGMLNEDDCQKFTDNNSSFPTKSLSLGLQNLKLTDSGTSEIKDPQYNNCGFVLNHKICIDNMFEENCSILEGGRGSVMKSIRTDENYQCPVGNDGEAAKCNAHKLAFNSVYPKCINLKKCDPSNEGECMSNGSMYVYIPSNESSSKKADRRFIYDWQDGICIKRGIEEATFESGGTVEKFGNYGKNEYTLTEENDSVISFNVDESLPYPLAIRNDNGGDMTLIDQQSIVPVPENYLNINNLAEQDRIIKKAIGLDVNDYTISARYFGDGGYNIEKIKIRRRNLGERSLCVKTNRSNSNIIEYGGASNMPAGNSYTMYIPRGCDYLGARVLGAGGKSEQWNRNARTDYQSYVITAGVGKGVICTGLAVAYGLCEAGCKTARIFGKSCSCSNLENKMNKCYADVDAYVQNEQVLTSGGGGGGAYTQGIIDVSKIDTNSLIITPGRDFSKDLPFYLDSTDIDEKEYNDYNSWECSNPDKCPEIHAQHSTLSFFDISFNKIDIFKSSRGYNTSFAKRLTPGGKAIIRNAYLVPNGYNVDNKCPTGSTFESYVNKLNDMPKWGSEDMFNDDQDIKVKMRTTSFTADDYYAMRNENVCYRKLGQNNNNICYDCVMSNGKTNKVCSFRIFENATKTPKPGADPNTENPDDFIQISTTNSPEDQVNKNLIMDYIISKDTFTCVKNDQCQAKISTSLENVKVMDKFNNKDSNPCYTNLSTKSAYNSSFDITDPLKEYFPICSVVTGVKSFKSGETIPDNYYQESGDNSAKICGTNCNDSSLYLQKDSTGAYTIIPSGSSAYTILRPIVSTKTLSELGPNYLPYDASKDPNVVYTYSIIASITELDKTSSDYTGYELTSADPDVTSTVPSRFYGWNSNYASDKSFNNRTDLSSSAYIESPAPSSMTNRVNLAFSCDDNWHDGLQLSDCRNATYHGSDIRYTCTYRYSRTKRFRAKYDICGTDCYDYNSKLNGENNPTCSNLNICNIYKKKTPVTSYKICGTDNDCPNQSAVNAAITNPNCSNLKTCTKYLQKVCTSENICNTYKQCEIDPNFPTCKSAVARYMTSMADGSGTADFDAFMAGAKSWSDGVIRYIHDSSSQSSYLMQNNNLHQWYINYCPINIRGEIGQHVSGWSSAKKEQGMDRTYASGGGNISQRVKNHVELCSDDGEYQTLASKIECINKKLSSQDFQEIDYKMTDDYCKKTCEPESSQYDRWKRCTYDKSNLQFGDGVKFLFMGMSSSGNYSALPEMDSSEDDGKYTSANTSLWNGYTRYEKSCDLITSGFYCKQFNEKYGNKSASDLFKYGSGHHFITINPLIGSGGCLKDSNDDATWVMEAKTTSDTGSDTESWGGVGHIVVETPFIKYAGTPVLDNGKKQLDLEKGVQDFSCMPKCPHANIKIKNMNDQRLQGLVCEYSSGDPANFFESNNNSSMPPIKCTKSDGTVIIPTQSKDRLCLYTKCNASVGGRYAGTCKSTQTSSSSNYIEYNSKIFVSGYSFFVDNITDISERAKYCDLASQETGEFQSVNGLLCKDKYCMYDSLKTPELILKCTKYGWVVQDGTPEYVCPAIKHTDLLDPSSGITTPIGETGANSFVVGRNDLRCDAFGNYQRVS